MPFFSITLLLIKAMIYAVRTMINKTARNAPTAIGTNNSLSAIQSSKQRRSRRTTINFNSFKVTRI